MKVREADYVPSIVTVQVLQLELDARIARNLDSCVKW
jgi:hypothetical protein